MKWLSLATVIAAAGSFAILLLSAWTLGMEVNVQFTAYWGMFFALTGVLGGLMQETTRAVGARDAGKRTVASGARPIMVALAVGAITFAVLAVTGPIWAPRVLDGNEVAGTLLMAGGLGLYAIQATVSGLLSARKLWSHYASLIIVDILIRVVPAVLAYLFGWGLVAWLVITMIGTISWLLLVAVSPATREVLLLSADVPTRRFVRLMFTAMWASGASAVLVTGFPTLIKLANDAASADTSALTAVATVTAGGVIYAVTLTRAPLLMPLEKFQNAIIVHFVHNANQPLKALAKPLGALVAFGAVGAALAWLIGPFIIRAILAPEYFVPGNILAGLTLAATATAVLMVTGAVTLAVGKHRFYMLGWVLATIVATAILFIPGNLAIRTIAALLSGSALGIATHLRALNALK